jgi:hypothetical protein
MNCTFSFPLEDEPSYLDTRIDIPQRIYSPTLEANPLTGLRTRTSESHEFGLSDNGFSVVNRR